MHPFELKFLMFKTNESFRQGQIFSDFQQFPDEIRDRLKNSWAELFYQKVFSRIDESIFKVLFSQQYSRPNFPVNILVGLEIIKELFDYTDEELYSEFVFNFQVMHALGIKNFGELYLAIRTLYYFRGRIVEHEKETGENLLEKVFKNNRDEIIKELDVKTGKQRSDSFQVGSNIKKMCRLELLVKVLSNFLKEIPVEMQGRLPENVMFYAKDGAEKIGYKLNRDEVKNKTKELGEILYTIQKTFENDKNVTELQSYEHVRRVVEDQFVITEKELEKEEIGSLFLVEEKKPDEIKSDALQNPADDEATYRAKNGKAYQGYIGNVTETCDKENPMQVITDIAVVQNNVSDNHIMEERLPVIKAETQVSEMIMDGGYSSEKVQEKMEEAGVELVITGIKGPTADKDKILSTEFIIEGNEVKSCPTGQCPIRTEGTTEIIKAEFDRATCVACPMVKRCLVKIKKKKSVLVLRKRQREVDVYREKMKDKDYREKCNLRPAVEGTVFCFKNKMRNGKLRFRHKMKIKNRILLRAIGINFKRMSKWMGKTECELVKAAAKVRAETEKTCVMGSVLYRFFQNLAISLGWR